MKKLTEQTCAPKISVGGMEFEMKISDGEAYAAGRAALAECLKLAGKEEGAVREALERLCGFVDGALGEGAMRKIAGDGPVSLPMALKILNAIIRTCADRYEAYIRAEYLGGERNEAVQPVEP